MDKCGECGTEFEIEDARREYNAEFKGDPDFDDYYSEGDLCGSCAVLDSEANMNHGNAILMMNGEIDYDADHVEKYL